MTIRYAMKQYGRKMKRNGIAFAAVAAVFAAALAATARTLDVTAYGAKPTAADIFRAVDGFEFINTRFSLHAKTAK